MLPWMLVLVLVRPDGLPDVINVGVETQAICEQRAQAIHDHMPTIPHVFKCIYLPAIIGDPV